MKAEQPVIGIVHVSYDVIAQVVLVVYWNVSSSSMYVFLLLRTQKARLYCLILTIFDKRGLIIDCL